MTMSECHKPERVTNGAECWKKPDDVMTKFYCRKKKCLPRSASSQSVLIHNLSGKTQKRKNNPFAKKQSISAGGHKDKKRILSLSIDDSTEPEDDGSTHACDVNGKNNCSSLFDLSLHAEEKTESDLSNGDLGFIYVNEDSLPGFLNETSQKSSSAETSKSSLPPDWSLKMKARFISPASFLWCARMKSSEEAAAIANATRCHNYCNMKSQSGFRIELGKCLMYWQHPYIPWLSLFPRYGSDCHLLPLSSDEPALPENTTSSLYDSWVTAFRSAYQLLRQGLCPYFYVCSQQYTALFQAATVTLGNKVNCVLTPTSLGFRNCLKSEGVNFSMPLQSKDAEVFKENEFTTKSDISKNNEHTSHVKFRRTYSCPFPASRPDESLENCHRSPNKPLHETSSQEDIDPEEELSWENISDGLQFRKAKDISAAVTNDGLPSTTIMVEGPSNTQILFNYLLNCRSSISTSGRQAGVPPTILSPVAFNGASLRKLDYRAGIAKINEETLCHRDLPLHSSKKQQFSLDVSGPLMPHHIHGIVSLLNTTQEEGKYSASLRTYTYTAPFNVKTSSLDKGVSTETNSPSQSATDCGLPLAFVQNLRSSEDNECLRKLQAFNSKYNWSV